MRQTISARQFPRDFIWGAATAAFQVEGYPEADGAGQSNWLRFCRQKGVVANDDCPDISPGQYRLYQEDIRLMREIGIKAYRFSLSWSRIFPEGRGRVNQAGVDYYNRLIDTLLVNGITPWITLFHWDLPQALEDLGGWRSPEIPRYLGDFATFAGKAFGDRCSHFFTVNEIANFTKWAFSTQVEAPGIICDRKTVNQSIYYGCLGHGYALAALHAVRGDLQIGLAHDPRACIPAIPTPEGIEAARKAFRLENSEMLTLMMEGKYTPEYLAKEGENAPKTTEAELRLIGGKVDFLGLNLYAPLYYVAVDETSPLGFRLTEVRQKHPLMARPESYVDADILYYLPKFCHDLWGTDIVISENGCAATDTLERNGEIQDTDRIMYLKGALSRLQAACQDGIPVKGYFIWSLLDNFEWCSGYGYRYGIVYVNHRTLERIPKWSASYYSECIRSNSVL
jgi:beta-glucosidase